MKYHLEDETCMKIAVIDECVKDVNFYLEGSEDDEQEDVKLVSGMTVIENEEGELISKRVVDGWRVCIDYRKLNNATRKYHFPLPLID